MLGRRIGADSVDGALTQAVYRGWMLRSERYAELAAALLERGGALRTDAAAYRRAHELPGWYDAMTAVTPASVWSVGGDRDGFAASCAALGSGPAVLRDYSKSMKHYWDEASYVPDVADVDGAWRVARRFLELRDDDLVGGLVLRRFEDFTGAEARTWWRDGACALVTAHPDTPDETPDDPDLSAVSEAVASVALPFVAVDLTLRTDGVWRVVELGDGQVSDRPSSCSAAEFVAAVT